MLENWVSRHWLACFMGMHTITCASYPSLRPMSREWDLRIWRVVSSFSRNIMCLLCLSDTSIFHQQQKVIEFMKHMDTCFKLYLLLAWIG